MKTPSLFAAPDEDDPDDPGDREPQVTRPISDAAGGEYILHFRDARGRFIIPPAR